MVSKRGQLLVDRLIEAAKEHAFIGSKRPEDHRAYEQQFSTAVRAVVNYIEKLEKKNDVT